MFQSSPDPEARRDGNEEPLVSDAAWERVLKDKAGELARLVAEGTLAGRRQGRRVLVNVGSFYDWIGESVPVFPDWGLEFEVRPDAEVDEVERLRRARRKARDALIRGPSIDKFLRDTAAGGAKQEEEDKSWGDEIAEALTTRIREETRGRWQELLAAEKVCEEAAAEFDGEDPALPSCARRCRRRGIGFRSWHQRFRSGWARWILKRGLRRRLPI